MYSEIYWIHLSLLHPEILSKRQPMRSRSLDWRGMVFFARWFATMNIEHTDLHYTFHHCEWLCKPLYRKRLSKDKLRKTNRRRPDYVGPISYSDGFRKRQSKDKLYLRIPPWIPRCWCLTLQKIQITFRSVPVFCPTWDEFKNWDQCMDLIENFGLHTVGIVSMIPPPQRVETSTILCGQESFFNFQHAIVYYSRLYSVSYGNRSWLQNYPYPTTYRRQSQHLQTKSNGIFTVRYFKTLFKDRNGPRITRSIDRSFYYMDVVF